MCVGGGRVGVVKATFRKRAKENIFFQEEFSKRLHFSFCFSTSHNCPTSPYRLVSGRFYRHALERSKLGINGIFYHLRPFLTLSHTVEIVSTYSVGNLIGLYVLASVSLLSGPSRIHPGSHFWLSELRHLT